MKNADMPAMPIVGGDEPVNMESSWYEYHGEHLAFGLTKREMMAMHMCAAITGSINSEECYQRIKLMSDNCGVKVSEWIARDAVKQADALLAELDRTSK